MRTQHSAFSKPRTARLTPLAAAFALALSPTAFAGIFTVTSTDTTLPTGLAQAINNANADCASGPEIRFNLTGTGPFVISPSTPLPALYCGTVNGFSQAGASANSSSTGFNATLKVTLDGSAQSYGCGLTVNSAGYGPIAVRGLTIRGFDTGVCGRVDLYGNAIRSNMVGADLTDYGSVVGGSSNADRNIFVNNSSYGLLLRGGGAYVENNLIGTVNGSSAAPNGKGIYVGYSGGYITHNVISGNSDVGIYVYADYGGTEIVENVIGLNSAGTAKLANGGGGVFVEELDGITISGNYISGNSVSGIGFQYASGLDISDNVIGLSYGGSPLANTRGIESYCGGYVSIYGNTIKSNQFEGIYLSGGDTADIESNTISDNGTSGVRIDSGSCGYGGLHYASDNTISGNKVDGILVTGSSVGNQFHANSIYGNTRKSINLNNNASTLPNDANDGDGGSNNQQNYPEITEVLQDAGTGNTTISFTLDSIDSTSFDVEFYSNPTPGNPAGREYLGSTTVFVYGGPYSGTFTAYGQLADNVSATATNASTYDTSELSSQKAAISAPAASVSPSNVNFGDVLVNTESATRTVTIRSIGDQPYVIDSIDSYGGFCGGLDQAASVAATPLSICASGSFICETTCDTGTAYSKGQSCRITAKFTPPFNGYQSTALYICDNTSVTPKQVYFEGNGILPPPITVSPRSWDFGAVPIGEAGEPHKFVVSNVGYGSLDLVSLATSGEYDVVNSTCGSFLYGGASCDVVVNFLPTMTGDSPGAFVATYSSYGGLDAGMLSAAQIGPTIYKAGATLTGVGIGGGELILPGPIELGAAVVGGSPVSRTVELRNSGTQPVNIASITISGPFTMVNNCTAPLAPGATCMVTISFTAPSIGDFNGSLTVVSDAAGGSGEIGVHATGQVVAGPLLQITPTAIGFGDRVIGSQSSAQTITITNVGGVTATLSLSTSSLDFLIAGNSCGATLAPQASCSALVAFRPLLGFGSRTGSFIVSSNAANSPQAVALGGTGCRPYVGAGNRSGEGSSSNCAP